MTERAGQVRLASPDMSPTLRQPEAVAMKVQAIGHAVGYTIGGHLAVLNFWQGWGKRTATTQELFLIAPQQPSSFHQGSDGSPVGHSPGVRSIPRKQVLTDRQAQVHKEKPCAPSAGWRGTQLQLGIILSWVWGREGTQRCLNQLEAPGRSQ